MRDRGILRWRWYALAALALVGSVVALLGSQRLLAVVLLLAAAAALLLAGRAPRADR